MASFRRWYADGKHVNLGHFNTAVQAAVAVAQHEKGDPVVKPAPVMEVKEAEGYKLLPSTHASSTTGYLGVSKHGDKFAAFGNVGKPFTSAGMIRRWRRRWQLQSTRQGIW